MPYELNIRCGGLNGEENTYRDLGMGRTWSRRWGIVCEIFFLLRMVRVRARKPERERNGYWLAATVRRIVRKMRIVGASTWPKVYVNRQRGRVRSSTWTTRARRHEFLCVFFSSLHRGYTNSYVINGNNVSTHVFAFRYRNENIDISRRPCDPESTFAVFTEIKLS